MDIFSEVSEVSPPIFLLVFVLGTIIGSFLNVVVFRLGTGERIGNARSRCFSCGKMLQWYDLVPLVSFILQRGKCRYCGSKISWQYPIVEFMTGLVFMLVAWNILGNFQFSIFNYSIFKLLYFWILFSILIAISVYDFRHKIIPNKLVYAFIILTFLFGNWKLEILNLFGIWDFGFSISTSADIFFWRVVAGFIAFAFFGGLWFVSRGRWMGFGDAELALGIGFLLGSWLTALAVMLSFWIGTLIAVPLVLWWGGGLKTQIPFGPFLALGTFISWLVGSTFLQVYTAVVF